MYNFAKTSTQIEIINKLPNPTTFCLIAVDVPPLKKAKRTFTFVDKLLPYLYIPFTAVL